MLMYADAGKTRSLFFDVDSGIFKEQLVSSNHDACPLGGQLLSTMRLICILFYSVFIIAMSHFPLAPPSQGDRCPQGLGTALTAAEGQLMTPRENITTDIQQVLLDVSRRHSPSTQATGLNTC